MEVLLREQELYIISKGNPTLKPEPSFVKKSIYAALRTHFVRELSNLRCFIDKIISENDIMLIQDELRKTTTLSIKSSDSAAPEPEFKDTPLFKRLEDIKHGKLTLHDMLEYKFTDNEQQETTLAYIVIDEIRSAIVCGFTKELLKYQIEGITAYPNIIRKRIAALDNESIIAINTDPNILPQLVDARLSQLKLRFDAPIEKLKFFFSNCLTQAGTLGDVEACIGYITSYQNTGGGVSLAKVLNCIVVDTVVSHSGLWLYMPPIRDVVFRIISYHKKLHTSRIKMMKEFNDKDLLKESDSGLDIICKFNIPDEYLPLCSKLFFHPTRFVEISQRNIVLFCKLMKALEWDDGLQELLTENLCKGDKQVIEKILRHQEYRNSVFQIMAKHSKIGLLIGLANYEIVDWSSGIQMLICNKLEDSNFCYIILDRLHKAGELSKIANIKAYYIYIVDEDPQLAVRCALALGDIEGFLAISSTCSIGQYIFSGECKNNPSIMMQIYEAVSLETFYEFVFLYGGPMPSLVESEVVGNDDELITLFGAEW